MKSQLQSSVHILISLNTFSCDIIISFSEPINKSKYLKQSTMYSNVYGMR